MTAFDVLNQIWGDVDAKTAQNGFPLTPYFKITLVNLICIPTDAYPSIGMVNLTAFDVFILLWGDVDANPAFWDIHGSTAPKPNHSDSLIQNNSYASYFYPNCSISMSWNVKSHCF